MSQAVQVLHIALNEVGNVRISREQSVQENNWQSLLIFYGTVSSKFRLHDPYVDIPLVEFVDRVGWLRENWIGVHGRNSVQFDPEVVKAIATVRHGKTEFAGRLGMSFPAERIDLDVLRLKRKLTDFQLRDLSALELMPNGANFSVPGAGKTATTLALWALLRSRGIVNKLLVVCPRSAFEAWSKEPSVLFFSPINSAQFTSGNIDPRAELLYVNYEQLENMQRVERLEKWISWNSAMVVFDEAHRVKAGPRSVRWRSCRALSAVSKRVDLLTGTPLPQSLEDLRNLFRLSWPDLSLQDLSESALQHMKRGGVYVRTTKQELGLPPMRVYEINVPMSTVQREVYSALRRNFASVFQIAFHQQGFFQSRGRAVMSLLAAATNPGLLLKHDNDLAHLGLVWPPKEVVPGSELMRLLESYARYEMPPKYKWVTQFVADAHAAGRKTLVWSSFVGNLESLGLALKMFQPAVIHGAHNTDEREQELHRFRNDPNCGVLLTNPQTLGEGINLHEVCHEAVYVDRTFNAAHYLQSIDRLHRLGLSPDQETSVYVLVSDNSIDGSANRRLAVKIERLGNQLDDEGLVQLSLPSDEDDELNFSDYVDTADLDELYSHLKDSVDEAAPS
jgi:SNF2 family DNA or RNA helicase